MKRAILIILSIGCFLMALALLLGGGVLVAIGSGDDPTIEGRLGDVRSTGYAVVSETMDVEWETPFLDRYEVQVGVSNLMSDGPVFIGYGPADAVDAYLAGVQHTEVHALGQSDRTNPDIEVPGTAAPQAPGEMTFWVEQSSGSGLQVVPVAPTTGNYRFVAMNADGSIGVALQVHGSMELPFLTPVGVGLMVGGGLLAILGVFLLVLGLRAKPGTAPPAAAAGMPYPGMQPSAPYAGLQPGAPNPVAAPPRYAPPGPPYPGGPPYPDGAQPPAGAQPGYAPPGAPGAERPAPEQPGPEQPGPEQPGPEQPPAEGPAAPR